MCVCRTPNNNLITKNKPLAIIKRKIIEEKKTENKKTLNLRNKKIKIELKIKRELNAKAKNTIAISKWVKKLKKQGKLQIQIYIIKVHILLKFHILWNSFCYYCCFFLCVCLFGCFWSETKSKNLAKCRIKKSRTMKQKAAILMNITFFFCVLRLLLSASMKLLDFFVVSTKLCFNIHVDFSNWKSFYSYVLQILVPKISFVPN